MSQASQETTSPPDEVTIVDVDIRSESEDGEVQFICSKAPAAATMIATAKGGSKAERKKAQKRSKSKRERVMTGEAKKVRPPKGWEAPPTLGAAEESESEGEELAGRRHKAALALHRHLSTQLSVLHSMDALLPADKRNVEELLRKLALGRSWRLRQRKAGLDATVSARQARQYLRGLAKEAVDTLSELTQREARSVPTDSMNEFDLVTYFTGCVLRKRHPDVGRVSLAQRLSAEERAEEITNLLWDQMPRLVSVADERAAKDAEAKSAGERSGPSGALEDEGPGPSGLGPSEAVEGPVVVD